MRASYVKALWVSLLLAGPLRAAQAQQVPTPVPAADTLHKYEHPATGQAAAEKKGFFQSKGFRATIVPAVLIGYGISPINGHGFYSSYDGKERQQPLVRAGPPHPRR